MDQWWSIKPEYTEQETKREDENNDVRKDHSFYSLYNIIRSSQTKVGHEEAV